MHYLKKEKKINNVLIISFYGEIGAKNELDFSHYMNTLVQENQFLILDFENLVYVNSTTIGTLAKSLKFMRFKNGDIKIVNLSPKLKQIFEVLKLSVIFDIYLTVEKALEHIKKDHPDYFID